jgi:hypothetical protein
VGDIPQRITSKARNLTVGRAKNPPATSTVQRLIAKHTVLVAKGTTVVPIGRTVAVKARLTAKGRRLLRKRGELKVTLRLVATGPTGQPSKLKRHILLRLPS